MTKDWALVFPLAFPFAFAFPGATLPAGSGVALKSRLRRYSSRAMGDRPQALLRFAAVFFAVALRAAGFLAAVLRAGAFLAGFRAGAVEPSSSPASTRSSISFIRSSR